MYDSVMNENSWRSRWSKAEIQALLLEQAQSFWRRDIGIERDQLAEIQRAAALPHAVIISGLRRAGKSTLLAQLAHRLGAETFYYVNFEDERFLGFAAEDANDLYALLIELFGERRIFVLDEIQNVPGWEHFVRRFMEMGLKFYITGSNASLLSRELGSRLTGRYVPIELLPFSLSEFVRFRGYALPDLTRLATADMARLQGFLAEYLRRRTHQPTVRAEINRAREGSPRDAEEARMPPKANCANNPEMAPLIAPRPAPIPRP